jgi:hypothetical protein
VHEREVAELQGALEPGVRRPLDRHERMFARPAAVRSPR